MILKIATGDGWRYFDGITEVNTHEITSEQYEKEYGGHGRLYDGHFLGHYTLTDGKMVFIPREDRISPPQPSVVEVWINGKNGAHWYLADMEVYLMSDEGKTIERIN